MNDSVSAPRRRASVSPKPGKLGWARVSTCAALSIIVLLASCGPSAEQEQEAASGQTKAPGRETPHETPWEYSGEQGPEHWADLAPEFSPCGEGVKQSPIDLTGAAEVAGAALERRLGDTFLTLEQRAQAMDLVDNGHTIQITNDVPMALDLDGEHYELVQYHFHAPSEHTIEGEHAPLEVHFVHKSAVGELAVIGLLVVEGAHDPLWDPVIAALPAAPGETRHIESLELDMADLQPLPKRYYRYRGSLTTPPCSEGVEWVVIAEPSQMSSQQITAFVSHLHDNNRPVQSLGDRELLLVSWE
jgi:carbonic anhydrase